MEIFEEARKVLSSCQWKEIETPTGDAICYQGSAPNDWHFVMVSFSIENQGFPKGSRGYDGTISRDGTLTRRGAFVRMTREMAEEVYKIAEKRLENNS